MLSAASLERLPIFPLERAVLVPESVLPLHIFEPRYRQMMEDALAQELPIGMAVLRPEGLEESPPTIHDVIGVGRIVEHERLPDGRFNLLLHGTWRARVILEHNTDRLYRMVQAVRLADRVENPSTVYGLMETVRSCVVCLQNYRPDVASVLQRLMEPDEGPGTLADRLAAVLLREHKERLDFLHTTSVDIRLRVLVDRLSDAIARYSGEKPPEGSLLN